MFGQGLRKKNYRTIGSLASVDHMQIGYRPLEWYDWRWSFKFCLVGYERGRADKVQKCRVVIHEQENVPE